MSNDFHPERLDFPAAPAAGGRPAADRGDGRARARAAWRELEYRRERRAAFHRGRYGGGDRADARALAQGVAPAAGGRAEPFFRYQRRQLGDDAMVVEEHRTPDRGTGDAEPCRIEEARWTLDEIEETTWGVTLREIEGDRFVVLPFGTLDNPPWTVRDQPAVKLSRE